MTVTQETHRYTEKRMFQCQSARHTYTTWIIRGSKTGVLSDKGRDEPPSHGTAKMYK